MADNHRGHPRDGDRDIYSSSKEQRNSQRTPHYRTNGINEPNRKTQGRQNRPEKHINSSGQNQRRNSNSTNRNTALNEEIDRYNYVNRDIYSTLRKSRKNGGDG